MTKLEEAIEFISCFNLSKLADKTGIHRNTLYNMKNGKHIPHDYIISRILSQKKVLLAEAHKNEK